MAAEFFIDRESFTAGTILPLEPESEELKILIEDHWIRRSRVIRRFSGVVEGLEYIHRPHFHAWGKLADDIRENPNTRASDWLRDAKIVIWATIRQDSGLYERVWINSYDTEPFVLIEQQIQGVAQEYDSLSGRRVDCEVTQSRRRDRYGMQTPAEFIKAVGYY